MSVQTSTLYFDVPEGHFADLEVVARTSIAWANLVKEVGFIVDPTAEVQVQFVTSTPGSAFINNLTRAVTKTAKEHPFVAGPLIAIATTFALAPAAHFGEDATVALLAKLGHKHDEEIGDESVEKIAQRVVALQRNDLAQQCKREMFRQPDRDDQIRGLGIGRTYDVRPALVVPRTEFPLRYGGGKIVELGPEFRYEEKFESPVVIVRSHSKAKELMWRFDSDMGEFSAKMKDKEFLEDIRAGHTGLEIGEGVEIEIDLKTKLDKKDGVWTVTERTIERVHRPRKRQTELHFPAD